MTREDAIKGLKVLRKDFSGYKPNEEMFDMAIKALEQHTSDDVMAIHTQGLDEGIRCAMCTNTMKSDRGCDGGCVVDEDMYKKVMDTIKNHIFNQPTSDDCVSRAEMLKYQQYLHGKMSNEENHKLWEFIKGLPPVTITHGTCKDCKHWKDSDGVYRRGIDAESKCPINNSRVFDGTFYCADYEKRGNEND